MSRAQAHTLEAVSGSILLLSAVIFALQMTAVTPLTASTASQHIENQQAGMAGGVLDAAAEDGSLEEALLYWNESTGTFHDVSDTGYYTQGGPPTPFGETLNETFLERGMAFKLNVRYLQGGDQRTEQMSHLGAPSDNAVTVTRSVTLYDDDVVLDADRSPTGQTVSDVSNFYAPDVGEGPVYNVLKVELIVWRM